MNLKNRVRTLENIITPEDAFRVIYIPDGMDRLAGRDQYREETGYTGQVVAIHENDPDLGREAIAAAVERHRQATGYRGTVVVMDETDRAL